MGTTTSATSTTSATTTICVNTSHRETSPFEDTFSRCDFLDMLTPLCGNSLVFKWQAISKTMSRACRELLEMKGRGPLLNATNIAVSEKAAALVEAVAVRDLIPSRNLRRSLSHRGIDDATGFLVAKRADQKFYDVLQKRCTLMQIYTNEDTSNRYFKEKILGLYRRMLVIVINKDWMEMSRNDRQWAILSILKIKIVSKSLVKKFFANSINTYASQPITQITIESYKAKIAKFPDFRDLLIKWHLSPIDIETGLRQALKRHHGEAFAAVANRYLDPDPDNAEVAALRTTLLQKALRMIQLQGPTAERDALERERLAAPALSRMARREAGKIGKFYRELNIPVTDANRLERWDTMQAVLRS